MEEILKMADEFQDVYVSSPNGNFKLPLKEYLENQQSNKKPQCDDLKDSEDRGVSEPNQVEDMQGLINFINKLQNAFASVPNSSIELPQIVVIGSQSAGKSSILESIVRRNFLPRGAGIVTRCPLILQLIPCPLTDKDYRSESKGTDKIKEWGVFLHKSEEIFGDFQKIRKEIEDRTDELAGDNKGICSEKITLTIYSPDVVNLTLVDLPGITKVAVGDQPENIEDQVKDLIFKHIGNKNSIILAVSAANTDLSTSEALKFAKQFDPEGARTLAVLTKLDLMDKGTDASEVLCGQVIPVKLGIVGVVNRSQFSINNDTSIESQLKIEAEFFESNYPDLADSNGTKYLEKRLSQILVQHIQKCLPNLKKHFKEEMRKHADKLKALGNKVVDRKATLIRILTDFDRSFSATIEGHATESKLFKIIHEDFENDLMAADIEEDFSKEVLDLMSRYPHRPALFRFPAFEDAFDKVVPEKIELLREPGLMCANKVQNELQRLTKTCAPDIQFEFRRFPLLQKKIFDVTAKEIVERKEFVSERINDMMETQLAYINKDHPNFDKLGALNKIQAKLTGPDDTKVHLTDLKVVDKVEILHGLVDNYMALERTIVQDNVAKMIMCYMVKDLKKNIGSKLISEILNSTTISKLMQEPKRIANERKNCEKMVEALRRALDIIDECSEIQLDIEEENFDDIAEQN